jgi:protein gp37
MAEKSSIEWTESTWNPITGCTKISDGCKNCYAERMSKRLKAMGNPNYKNGFDVTIHPNSLNIPLRWKSSRLIFVNSMSDLFHEDVPIDFIKDIFEVMIEANWHQFQILTKRADRLAKIAHSLEWADNIWMGVSVENDNFVDRIDFLRKTNAKIKFISFEPLIGPIKNCNYQEIDWVIVGGESGPRSRPIEKEWVLDIRDSCVKNNVPFFFKQWGGFNKKKAGRELEGTFWSEMPVFEMVAG